MKQKLLTFAILAAIVTLFVVSWHPEKEALAQPASLALTVVLASAIDADGTFTTVTLSQGSPDCTFINRDTTATNTLDLTINGDADTIRLYGGDVYYTNNGPIPIWVSSFSSAAVVGTPDIQYYCWGRS